MGIRQLKNVDAKRMVGDLTSGRTLFWIGVALVVHAVLIAGTSVGYIRDRWIDPAGAEARRQQELQAAAAPAPAATQPTPVPAPARVTKSASAKANPDAATEKRMLEQRKDSKVVRDITEPAKREEIPKEPSRNGFDLDEQLN